MKAKTVEAPQYAIETEDQIIQKALVILESRIKTGPLLTSPPAVKDFLRLKIATLPHEVFYVLFLDSQHGLIEADEMFRGTLNQTSIYPREVLKRAMHHNAAAVILAHNHPSGSTQPSRADEQLTKTLKDTLALVDVRVLDHLIVTAAAVRSMAEMGLV